MSPPVPLITRRMTSHPADSHTLARYEATGGYAQARRAMAMTRDELVDVVKASGLLGRGGAAFSAGLKWGFLAPATARLPGRQRRRVGAWHLQGPSAARARPPPDGRGDRHRRRTPTRSITPSSTCGASTPEAGPAVAARRRRGLRGRLPRPGSSGPGYRPRGHRPPRGRGLHLRRGDGPLNSLEGLRGEPRLKPPYFPAVKGLYMQADDRQQRRDVSNLPDHRSSGGAATTPSGRG
jgi:NADH-quinone oxidoreductase subunit F